MAGVVNEQVGYVWNEAAPLLKPALGEGETLEQVYSDLLARKAQLWIAATETEMTAACVTEIFTRGKRKYCNIWLTGGLGLNNWMHFLETIEEWAKENGCNAMLISHARTGWKRLLKEYRMKTITLTKDL